jgi:hypothetical protein
MVKRFLIFMVLTTVLFSCGQEKNEPGFISHNKFVGTWKFRNTKGSFVYLMNISGKELTFRFNPDGSITPIVRSEPHPVDYTWDIQGKYLILRWKKDGILNLDNKLEAVKQEGNCVIFKPIKTGTVKVLGNYKACKEQ